MQSLEKEELERRGLQQRAAKEAEEGVESWDKEGSESRFRPIHNVASAFNIPQLLHQQTEEPELTFLAEEEITAISGSPQQPSAGPTAGQSGRVQLPEGGTLVHSTPVDKTRNLQHFLASFHVPVVVGSSTDDGIGENIPTSNSGSAYSSPMYTPPEEESIHMHMAAQCREQELSGEEKEALTGEESSGGAGTGEEGVKLHTEGQNPSRVPPSPSPSPPQFTAGNRDNQEESGITVGGAINSPVSHSHRSYSLPQSLSGYIVRGDSGIKLDSRSPPTSSQGLASLLRRSPIPTMPEVEPLPSSGTPPEDNCREGKSDEEPKPVEKWAELRGDTALENMTPRSREKFMHHRRTKSDSRHDTSGPIRTTQISSVPERVKEIEEKVTSTQSLHSVNQTTGDPQHLSAVSSNSRSSSEECLSPGFGDPTGDRAKCSLQSSKAPTDSLARHASLSPKPSLSSCTVSSSSSPSSAHLPVQTSFSLPSSGAPTDPDSTSPPPPHQDTVVNSLHGVVKAKVQDFEGKKVGAQTPVGEPRAVTGVDAVVKRTSVLSGQRPQSEIIFHTPYVGVVEVNEPSDTESQSSTASSTTRELDGVTSLLQPHYRSAFTSVRGHEGGATQRQNTAYDIPSAVTEQHQRDSRGSLVQSGAVFNAWAGMLPTEHLRADDLASVLELRRKFERGSPKDPSRRIQQQLSSLRRSRSLRDTRLTSPPVRLGGSARWKKCSSNVSLQRSGEHRWRVCASASPTASGSQQSLLSSGKM